MKRRFTSYLLVLFALLLTANTAKAEAVQSADRDKINGIVMDLVNTWDHSSFQNAAALITQVAQYDLTNVTSEGVARLMGMRTAIDGTPDYRLLFSGKAFTGHYVVQDGAWVKESDATDLQFSYTSPNGVPCVLKMVISGDVKTANMPFELDDMPFNLDGLFGGLLGGDDDDDDDYYARRAEADDESAVDMASDMMDDYMEGIKEIGFEFPAQTTIELTYGGAQMMLTNIQVDLSSIGTTLLDGLIMSVDTKFFKGVLDPSSSGLFELSLVNSGYKPVTGINVDFSIKKDNEQLVSFKVIAPGTFDMNNLVSEDGINIGFESLNVDIDVMGRAQLKGGISHLNTLANMIASNEDAESEEEVKAVVAQLNQLIDFHLYYDGSSNPAATVQLAAVYDAEYEEWSAEPQIVFARDNSSYALEEFFSTENFPDVLAGVMNIVEEVGDVAEVISNKAEETIQSVTAVDNQLLATEFFTLDGKRTSGAAKGLKIVRMSDGSVRKVMTK